MYCNICISALKTWPGTSFPKIPHHTSFHSLHDSARLGCPICSELLRILPGRDYSGKPGEPAPCTEFYATLNRPVGYIKFLFCPDWLADRLPVCSPQDDFEVTYYPVLVKAEELREEMNLRAGTGTLETYRDRQSVATLFGVNTRSDQSWRLIQHWVMRCDKHHQTCKKEIDTEWFPTRLIYIGKENEDSHLYVPDITSWNPDNRYTTLSHRWGSDSSQVAKLKKGNLDTLQQKIHTQGLPQTFRDAIGITKRLGLQFLWIDSLCIIQDDDEDWAREAANMSMIYANTYLNISATSAQNCHQGCYRSRDPMKIAGFPFTRNELHSSRKPWIHPKPDGISRFRLVNTDIWRKNVDEAPLNQRGWVLQERMLSSRVLHFSADQVLWECRENYACETLPELIPKNFRVAGLPTVVYLRDFVPRRPFASYGAYGEHMETELWSKVVETYSKTDVTFRKDKLVALSGIAREIQYLLKSTYAAGLWRCHLPYSLLWVAKRGGHRSNDYLAPSWSWASVEGPVLFPYRMRQVFKSPNLKGESAILLDLGIDLVTPTNPFGQVKNGWIRVRGKVGVASWKLTEPQDKLTTKTPISLTNNVPPFQACIKTNKPEEFYLSPNDDDFHTLVLVYLDDTKGIPCQQAFILPIYCEPQRSGHSADGLLLQLLPTGHYTRIGMLSFIDDRTERILASFEEKEIVII